VEVARKKLTAEATIRAFGSKIAASVMSSQPISMQVRSDPASASRSELDLGTARRALTAVPDRAAREAAAALARQTYCAQLKEARERLGISLDVIAERTKVNESLFAALERGDLSRWPTGIYRRAFFREYASAIGLPAETAVGDFLQLFPDDHEARSATTIPLQAGPLRLGLAGRSWLRFSRLHVIAAFVDIAIVFAITAAVAWWMPVATSVTAAVVSVTYYSIATACLACSPGSWWLRTRGNRRRARALRLAR
jgi:transcriptional regulator with XRE-family HTH domain